MRRIVGRRHPYTLNFVNHLNEDSYQMVHVLLKYGADMLIRNCYGQLPFEEALALSNKKVCKAFVDWGLCSVYDANASA